MKTTTSNYNAFNAFANSHKVQLSIDVQNLLEEETKAKSIDSIEDAMTQWAKLPVLKSQSEPSSQSLQTTAIRGRLSSHETTVQLAVVQLLPADLPVEWEQPNELVIETSDSPEAFRPSATGLRRVITKYRGLRFTQSLPVAEPERLDTLLVRLRPMILDRRQEQKARLRWFGTKREYQRAQMPDYTKNLLDNACTRWSP